MWSYFELIEQKFIGFVADTNVVKTTGKRKTNDAVAETCPPEKRINTTAEAKTKPLIVVQDEQYPHVPTDELDAWYSIAEENGWTPEDCLQHKLIFQKRCDPSKKVDGFAGHLKKLRAAGWYLVDQWRTVSQEVREKQCALDKEREMYTKEKREHEEKLNLACMQAEDLKGQVEALEITMSRREAEIERCQKELEQNEIKIEELTKEHNTVSEKLKKTEEEVLSLKDRIQSAETCASDAQKYAMTLQEFNSKLQGELADARENYDSAQQEKIKLTEEIAELRGRVSTLVNTLQETQKASSAAESARLEALEDAARLRADLAAAASDRNSLSIEVQRLREDSERYRGELDRFREATGKELVQLEAEKEANAALSTRAEAQSATLLALQQQLASLREEKMTSEALADVKGAESRKLASRVAELEALLESAERRARDAEAVRRRLHNTILELKGNVRVFCRIRPLLKSNKSESNSVVSAVQDGEEAGRALEIICPGKESKREQKQVFAFDTVFPPEATQETVFDEVTALVQSALDGYKVCLFAYGQTGAGKTHTMIGTQENAQEGVIPRAIRQVFSTAESSAQHGWKYEMKAAMLEIYNEEIRDLLGKGPPQGKKHVISHEKSNGEISTSVSFLEWYSVDNSEKLTSLIKKAMVQRSVGATACNEQSSRSHMVFMLVVDGTNEITGQKLHGALNLIDLAGSERLARSGAEGSRLKETQAINKSLSALGDVIAALGSKEPHVPYRNSKLTYLLQGSLSGAGKALMLCNISPRADDAPETLSTLRFAAKVNACEIGTARRNVTAMP